MAASAYGTPEARRAGSPVRLPDAVGAALRRAPRDDRGGRTEDRGPIRPTDGHDRGAGRGRGRADRRSPRVRTGPDGDAPSVDTNPLEPVPLEPLAAATGRRGDGIGGGLPTRSLHP